MYGVVALEVAAITGAYYVWHNMNTSQSEKIMYPNTVNINCIIQ